MTGSWVVPRMRVRSSSAADPGQEALRRSYRQTRTAVDSLRGPVGNSPSARRGGAEGADSPGAASPGLGDQGRLGRRSTVAESAPPALGLGWGRRKRGPRAAACGREGPREAEGGAGPEWPPAPGGTAHQSTLPLGPPGHLEPQGTEPQLRSEDTHSPDRLGECGPGELDPTKLADAGCGGESSLRLPPRAQFLWRRVGRACRPVVRVLSVKETRESLPDPVRVQRFSSAGPPAAPFQVGRSPGQPVRRPPRLPSSSAPSWGGCPSLFTLGQGLGAGPRPHLPGLVPAR
ncbi:unnamed protein product [Rangifer tarandus platyrhynchus]|uniref:Uncharacterized protein n=1 Tax=Rangifer tarandus platyrhynchus TaxID=3082113 RepID=A0AC60A8I9_RANTA